jgi:hypothetical protein
MEPLAQRRARLSVINFALTMHRRTHRCARAGASVLPSPRRFVTVHAPTPDFGIDTPGFTALELEALGREIARLRSFGLFTDSSTVSGHHSFELRGLARASGLFRALPFHPGLRSLIERVVPRSPCLMLSNCFLKPARTGIGTRWHADDTDYPVAHRIGDSRTFWIAVDDVTPTSGPLRVLPGVRPRAAYRRDPENTGRVMVTLNADEQVRVVECVCAAGTVAHFDFATFHSTANNEGESDRAALSIHVLSAESFRPGYPPGRGPFAFIAGPHSTNGRAEYGVDLAERWAREVERARLWQAPDLNDDSVLSLERGVELATTEVLTDDSVRATSFVVSWSATPTLKADRALSGLERDVLCALDGELSIAEVLEALERDPNAEERANLFAAVAHLVDEDVLVLR